MEAIPLGWPLVAAGIALVAAGAIQGSTGFGFSMLAAPLLAVVDPDFVPAPMLMMAFLISFGGMIRERQIIDRRGLGYALAGRVFASVAAVACLGLLAPDTFSTVFGVLVLFAVVLSVAGLRVEATSRNLFLAGSLSGFMGTLTSIGAPPMAIVYQNSRGPVMRATLNAFFVVGAGISLAALGWAGRIDASDVILASVMLPFAVAGFLLSSWGKRLVDRGQVKVVVLVVSTLSALILIGRTLS